MANSILDASKAPSKEVYMMNRGWMGSTRLSLQHHVLESRYGWLVPPKISASLKEKSTSTKETIRIADVAAGSCIWTVDVLKEFPDAQVTGFDVSTDMYPPEWALPSNVLLETYNVFESPPEKYLGYFDMIHMRLIIAAILEGGYGLAIRNVAAMLKPGGWFHWEEIAGNGYMPIDPSTLSPVIDFEIPRFIQIVNECTPLFKVTVLMDDIQSILKEAGGLVETENYRAPIKKELLSRESQCFLMVYQELFHVAVEGKSSTELQSEFLVSLAEEANAIKKGKLWAHNLVIGMGRKA